jgi:hypothetical protein
MKTSGRPLGDAPASEPWYATCHMCTKRMAARYPKAEHDGRDDTLKAYKGTTVSVSSQTSMDLLHLLDTQSIKPRGNGVHTSHKQTSDFDTPEIRQCLHRLAGQGAEPVRLPRQRQHSNVPRQKPKSSRDLPFQPLQKSGDCHTKGPSPVASIEDSALHDIVNMDLACPGDPLMIDSLLREVCCKID